MCNTIESLITAKGVKHTTKQIVETMNSYFVSVFNDDQSQIEENMNRRPARHSIADLEVDEESIRKIIQKLNINKTSGPDLIESITLKSCCEALLPYMKILFNSSIQSSEIPQDFKDANVVPIFKKGDKQLSCNYRPVSLTSILGKILESLVKNCIADFLNENELVCKSQHRFINKRSTNTNLIEFYDDVLEQFSHGGKLDIIYLDLQKAFVPHKSLLLKMKMMGIQGKLLKCVQSWLSNRRQRVVMNKIASEWDSVASGVPQGGNLSPLLFVIYINDIDEGVKSKVVKFADDLKIWAPAQNASRQELQNDLNKLHHWTSKWGMNFNVNKCHVVHWGNNNEKFDYTIDGQVIPTSTSERDLGVQISNDGKFSEHCEIIVSKANRLVGMICRTFNWKSKENILTLYQALVRPHLEYGSPLWSPLNAKNIKAIESVQRRATRMIPQLRHLTYDERLKVLKMDTLEKRRLRRDIIEMYKILNNLVDFNFDNHFQSNVNSSNRSAGKLKKKSNTNNISKHRFCSRIVGAWNALPNTITDIKSLEGFIKKLDEFLKNNNIDYYLR